MEPTQRRQAELAAYHEFKQKKENKDILYLIDQKWIESWITYLRGGAGAAVRTSEKAAEPTSPDYIQNERLERELFRDPDQAG
jgi:hypothetical protein